MSGDALFRICVITLPLPKIEGGNVLLSNLLSLLEPLSSAICVITGNFSQDTDEKIHVRNVPRDDKKQSMLIRVPKFILTQLRICSHLVRVTRKTDIVLFFIGGSYLPLPMLTAKLLRKRTILITTGSGKKTSEQLYRERVFGMGGFIFSHIVSILEELTRRLSDRIVVYSPGIIPQLGLGKYKGKLSVNGARFIDMDLFQPENKPSERRTLVGFVGRLSQEKGIINFVRAIPLILEQRNEVEFLIGGGGTLFNEVGEKLENSYCRDSVTLAGWIHHEKLPSHFNEIKLLVVPSYTEGLPNIILEAMACGTPVLATPVGGVPDVIRDGETGFILEDNSPECIAKNVIRVLDHPNLDEVSANARALVERRYNYQAAVERYRVILGATNRSAPDSSERLMA